MLGDSVVDYGTFKPAILATDRKNSKHACTRRQLSCLRFDLQSALKGG